MPPQAYALVTTFMACSVVLGWLAVRLVARLAGGPRGWRSYAFPVLAGFGAFYLIGHRLGVHVGPEVPLYGFQVNLLGDLSIGFASALIVALLQAIVARSRRRSPAA
jgi:hypothetical protein